ncbi:VENN motif pre-toxin domain-containing protein [Enterobacter cloacae]|nr:VENN motif pre-toxin domain-containing protein [Enterobacter cloacae]
MLYPDVKDLSKLSEEQKQTVSALATISAGMAGGLAGDSTASAAAGAQAGKNAVENNSLAGDKAREAAKHAAESLKNQVREKMGEGTASSIANGIINALADTGDAALGSADYAADAAMALASCAAGDSYCSKAMSDLAGKNQAVADSVSALMQGETWSTVADTVKQAAGGNQAALEATGGLLAGIMLPGKKLPNATSLETALKASVVDKILNADRVGSGLKPDPTHRGASYLSREQLMDGEVFTIKGGDGIERKLLQAEGSFNDKKGIFEYIYDDKGHITHQRFIEGGSITGAPNQKQSKVK